MAAQDAKEDVESTLRLLYKFSAQMLSFGPVLATKMSVYSTVSLPWGLGTAGAETVKQGVDSDNAEGISTMTACMVKLGMLGTVHDIVVSLCEQDRADAVAVVTGGLLSQGEVVVVTQITNSLIASGHSNHAATISGHLISQGNTQIYEVIKEAGLNMGLIGGDSDPSEEKEGEEGRQQGGSSSSGGNLLQSVQKEGAAILQDAQKQSAKIWDRVTPNAEQGGGQSQRDGGRRQQQAEDDRRPDADALFKDWSGAPSQGKSISDESANKTDRLL